MYLALLTAGPCLIGQLLASRASLFVFSRAAVVGVSVAVALLVGASQTGSASRIMVPAAFAIGTLVVVHVVWTSSQRRWITGLVGAGALSNLLPIAVHGAMPVSHQSWAAVADAAIREPALVAAKHAQQSPDEKLHPVIHFLSDWIAVPGAGAVISIGDLALLGGFVALGVHRRRRESLPHRDSRIPWVAPTRSLRASR